MRNQKLHVDINTSSSSSKQLQQTNANTEKKKKKITNLPDDVEKKMEKEEFANTSKEFDEHLSNMDGITENINTNKAFYQSIKTSLKVL